MLIYPIVLTAVSFLVVFSLIIFVLPQFAEIFDQFEIPLPMLTEILLAIGNEIVYRCWIWIPLAIAAIVGFITYQHSPKIRCRITRLPICIPEIPTFWTCPMRPTNVLSSG